MQGEGEVLVLLSSAHDVRDGNDGARCSCLRPDLERKHHFDCSIFQKNIRFIAQCFIVFCLILLSNDAEKENMRQQDQNTGRLRTPRQSPEKQNRHPREASAGKDGTDVRHDRSIANHQTRLVSRNNRSHSINRSRPIGPIRAD